ncbi:MULTISPECIES: ectoine/hydroxyectoine ABC transporter permease subunit EhuD [Streptomyces]|uniref:Ectoine/hydroxyectoine ABC transporter permease subunit EhuD n=1 Tax=Streptomyces tsukubensis (strain DSM 42081 / NBRC 108919 / NRRL 18488 / 9993) TaxID=1114943 RepID=I2MYP4_STRT9|nr:MULTISPECIES: ectoine/hydroxyectoine ABC transporter permease subunit EhuD [Streptomyces]AZK94196.1 ectoine/hydroxyectoine ABC transporter permease subunit EhuD [Streptomyces tsukubensis]EIF89891.1 amino acid ABC transporter permease [Streptomyces tsukubensis NRRL18488]MYS65169.1 ectoine/hydroxyectoine ABC transporter permease subunit EhuD [Streptomyces sp. SID5473]QKM69704.1 ectoine/hydroxyectoine ABC transporter permease subunit EhuD [Streptomyces tsukubensis NRRL18488]TAI46331.1 ectoine/
MRWDWNAVGDFMPRFWDGLLVTLQALVLGALLAFALGLVWALALRSPYRAVRWPVAAATEFVRNTPLLVQLFFLYYVLPEWGLTLSAMATGVIGLGLHYSTYTAEVYRAGIDGVPAGQWEAATALSLPRVLTWRSVILPQAVRRVVPALGNYVIAMLKDTPMIFVIGVMDMLGQARQFAAETFLTVEAFTVVGIAFIALSFPASLLLRALERRLVR